MMSRLKLLAVLCAVAVAAGCATQPVRPKPAGAVIRLPDLCRTRNILWEWDGVSQVMTLTYQSAQARTMVDSSVVIIDGDKIYLSEPVRRQQGTITVPPDFERKVLDAIMGKAKTALKPAAAWKYQTIIIDPGHGGKDPGCIGHSGIKEKRVVLDIAKRLQNDLQTHGMVVKMTREDDRFISLPERTVLASSSGADVFVSIHANSSPSRAARGLEVYYLNRNADASMSEDQKLANQKTMFRRLKMVDNSSVLDDIIADMLDVNKRSDSQQLADFVITKTSRILDEVSRGSRQARYFVVRNTVIPAILIEVGYLTNPVEEKLLSTAAYRQKVADAIAKSLLDYADGSSTQ